MHDLRLIREQGDLLRAAMRRRGALDGLEASIARGEELDR